MTGLILKRASASRLSGEWSDDDYDVLADGAVVGRIFKVHAAPEAAPWMWTLAFGHHEDRTPTRLRADARGRDGDRINAVLAAAGYNVGAWYNEDRRQLQLMDGWQASEAWRADRRAE
jgi:hypothetical protein